MKPEKLNVIKKELASLNQQELIEICLRMAKYKKDNKELLNYLLFNADDPQRYIDQVKEHLSPEFDTMPRTSYQSTKALRKILRLIGRYSKYTANKEVEIELLLWFSQSYLTKVELKTHHRPLQTILIRQFEKIRTILPKLHEDLQFDYKEVFGNVLSEAESRTRWISKNLYL